MVREWGFSAEVGPISYGPEGPSRDNPFAGRPYAEETQRSIDQEVARLLREAEDTATKLLSGHRETLDRVIACYLSGRRSTVLTWRPSWGRPDPPTTNRPERHSP
jgi:ATP-dependent Zn protease